MYEVHEDSKLLESEISSIDSVDDNIVYLDENSFEERLPTAVADSIPVITSDSKAKVFLIGIISVINGALYFTVAEAGGGNIERLFHADGDTINKVIFAASVGASVVYTMFTYKTLEALSLKANSPSKILFSLLGPFSAVAFLTAGVEGTELLGFNKATAISIGMSLFALRTINCVDASVKFPARFSETRLAWTDSVKNKDYKEIARLLVIGFMSLGYSAATTDAVFSAVVSVEEWFGIDKDISYPVAYTSSLLGAIGTLPLVFYWGHRGLRQLTFGGKINDKGENPDPTDRYTYIGLLLVSPVMLGILGGATAASGEVFGRLGYFSDIIRVSTSVLYGMFAGTPGMATLVRSVTYLLRDFYTSYQKKNNESNRLIIDENDRNEREPLLINKEIEVDARQAKKSNWCDFFKIIPNKSDNCRSESQVDNLEKVEKKSKGCTIL